MGEVVRLPERTNTPAYTYQCECGSRSFELLGTGEALCTECDRVANGIYWASS